MARSTAREPRAGTRRRAAALPVVVATAAATAAGVVTATPAVAAGADSLSFGGDRAAITVGANAVVRIDGRLTYVTACGEKGIPDFVYPATDVYVVAAPPVAGQELKDAAGGPPNTIVSSASMFIEEIIAITGPSGSLGDGTYSVVYDTCQDGRFDAGVDTVFPSVLTVRQPAVLPSASMAIVDLKGAAEEEAYSWKRAHALFETIEKIKDIPDLVSALKSPDIDSITSILLGKSVDGLNFTAGVTDGFKRLMLNMLRHYAAIAADPPDRDFDQVTVIAPVPTSAAGDGRTLDDAVAGTLVPMAGEAALAEALLHAIERYQGAQAAGDAEWALTHARQAADLADALAAQTRATSAAVRQLRDGVQDAPADIDGALAAVREHSQRVGTSGFTPDERRDLLNFGFTPLQIAARETASRPVPQATPIDRVSIVAHLDALLAAHDDTAAALATTRTAFAGIAEQLDAQTAVPDVAPTADAGGPYSAARGAPVVLDGSASVTPEGSGITAYEWDLDADGAFDDATGAAPSATFGVAGAQLVGLRVTNSLDRRSVGYATVDVAGPAGPAVPSVTPDSGGALITVGTPQAFTASADGEITWWLDGAAAGSGGSFTYDPAAEDVGLHEVEARVTAPGGSASRFWDVGVVDVDADGDGWTRTPDCADDDAAVHPGMFEVLGNGVDDDCDAGTPDAPPGGLTGSIWSWGANHSGGAGTGSTDHYVRPPAMIAGYDDIVQVESSWRVGHALRADGRVLGWGANYAGQVGDGTDDQRSRPTPVVAVGGAPGELSGVVELEASHGDHALARRADGTVVAWGENRHRQLGDGSTSNSKLYPVPVLTTDGTPLTGVRDVEAGRYWSYARMDDGSVQVWGTSHCLGGTRLVTRSAPTPVVTLGSSVRQIATGLDWSMFRLADGSVVSCGSNTNALGRRLSQTQRFFDPHPVIGFGPGSGVVDIAAGYESGAALKADGSVWVWGWNGNGSLTAAGVTTATTYTPVRMPLPPGPPVVDIENDEACHTQALRADGSILIWGCDTHGSSGIVPPGTVEEPTVLQLPAAAIATSASTWNGLALARPLVDTAWERPASWVEASIADAAGLESDPGSFEVALSESRPHGVTLTWSVEPGTAGAEDLRLDGGTVTVPAGATSARIPAPVVDDGLDEAEESYTLVLTGASHDLTLARSQATGTVTDDDDPPAVSVGDATVAEGDTSLTDATVPVRLSAASSAPVTVALSTADGSATAPEDYAATTTTVTVPAGETEVLAHLPVHGDTVLEPDETFTVRLTDPVGAVLGDGEGTVTLTDDEPLALAVSAPTVVESDGEDVTASFAVTLEPPAPDGTTVTVPWSLAGGTADVPGDVTAAQGRLSFEPGVRELTVNALVTGDDESEPTERFRLLLGNAESSDGRLVLPADAALALIEDDDPSDVPPVVEAGADVTAVEGAAVGLAATVTDPDSTTSVVWSADPGPDVDAGASCAFTPADAAVTEVTCSDDGTWTLTATADDGVNPPVADDLAMTVANAAPTLGAVAVHVAGDGTRTVTVPLTDPGADTHTCTLTWGDGTPESTVPASAAGCVAAHRYAPGTHTVTVTAVDDDGGRDSVQRSLLVYGWAGFFAPVSNPPAVNTVTAGQAIPLKFGLGGYQGMDVFADGYPASRPCGSAGPLTATSLPGSADLTYARGDDRYQYVWKTERSWRGTCRELVMRFADGNQRTALFRFR